MTETSPIVTPARRWPSTTARRTTEIVDMQVKQGRQVYRRRTEARRRATGATLPHDGKSVGELKVRGNWVISGYFKGEGGKVVDEDGWFGTGDVATIDPDGYVQLTDRLKDVIKSGGEWISSIEIENLVRFASRRVRGGRHRHRASGLAGAPAAVGAAQARPQIRPSSRSWISCRRKHRQMVDAGRCVFVDSLPHTATGKLLKTELRAKYGGQFAVAG